MNRFHVIDDACAILRRRGVYRQVNLYFRGEQLYARLGSGYIRLLGRGGTTAPDVSWEEYDAGAMEITLGKFDAPMLKAPVKMLEET